MHPNVLPLRAAGYVRSGCNCPDQLAAQEAVIRQAVARNGDVLDEALMLREAATGPDPVTDYPVLGRFLDMVTAGASTCSRLYVRDITRFGRYANLEDLWALYTLLGRHGVEIYVVEARAPYIGPKVDDTSPWGTPAPVPWRCTVRTRRWV